MTRKTKKENRGKIHIIPTVFAKNINDFRSRLNLLLPFAKEIQIDVMDGKFVPARSVPLRYIPSLRKYETFFEAHLMVKDPQDLLPTLKRKGFSSVIAHVEAFRDVAQTSSFISKAKRLGLQSALAISPGTPLKLLDPFLGNISFLLFLGVRPGKEGQKYIPSVTRTIRAFLSLGLGIPVQVDGGVDPKTARGLVRVGVRRFNVGSFIAGNSDPRTAFKKMVDSVVAQP